MARPLTVGERRRRGAERAGAAAILLAGPLLGLVLLALTGAWAWLLLSAALLPVAYLGARRVARESAATELRRGLLSPRRWRAAGRAPNHTAYLSDQPTT